MAVEVRYSPNSAGVVIDAAGCGKLGVGPGYRRRGHRTSSYFMVAAATVCRSRSVRAEGKRFRAIGEGAMKFAIFGVDVGSSREMFLLNRVHDEQRE
jgi:hypothetical protein